MEWSEAELASACQQGDRCAQQQLFEDSQAKIYRLMVRMVGLQDAADVTQQVYLQVYRTIGQFSGRSRLSTWLYRVSVNEALQFLRRKNRMSNQSLKSEPVDYRACHEERSEQAELLEAAFAHLEPELRAIFLLREVEEMPYHEIAAVLKIPEGTVGSRLNRARRELRERLTESGWDP